MILAAMQPYFFPYLGYFSLIEYSDRFILFDPVQHIRHGWIERNRILKPGEGWQYFSVPLEKHSKDTLIKDLQIKYTSDWKDRIFRQQEHYKKKSPYYTNTVEVLKACFSEDFTSIVKLNEKCLVEVCNYLGIEHNFKIFSEMDLKIGPVSHAGEWAFRISEALGADVYVNPPGGEEIFDKEQFRASGIELKFLKSRLPEYSQRRPVFENGLSIIDVMMFRSPEEIREMVKEYDFI